ncbi:FMN-binding protein [Methylotenera sp.]|uniref:FMN-binding protein n=1 Tax=Methylotenera sp. TaxID=2051956 RepID=UPI00248A4AEC|nr:FMN-binding protein [Methylotenera sp.]MDI1363253.1 FMN-binding protein [Methylotenera sp.]
MNKRDCYTLVLRPQSFEARPAKLTSDQQDKIKSLSGLRQRWDTQQIWRAVKNGKTLGWFVVDEVIGKHEFITYAVGLSPDGHVLGVEIMTYRETYGGGVRNAIWRQHLVGKTLADPFKLDEDVPNISGGTLSSRNVMDGVKRVLAIQKVLNLVE